MRDLVAERLAGQHPLKPSSPVLQNRLLSRSVRRVLALACLAAFFPGSTEIRAEVLAEPDSRPTLYLIGDSTMANKPVIPANAERGWGQMLPAFFTGNLRLENHAVNGRSSKSFIAEGKWAAITNRLKPGDWALIQFGHNDEKQADPKRFTEPFGGFSPPPPRPTRSRMGSSLPTAKSPANPA